MSSTFKQLGANDKVSSRTLVHEAIPITGSIVSGTYEDNNIKNYGHGMFQSVYDYPYLSSSANHIFDITVGYDNASALSGASNSQNSKKINIYNQMSQMLVGYDLTGTVGRFDLEGTSPGAGSESSKMNEVFFFNFSRLLTKDEIKKGTFQLELGIDDTYAQDGTVFANRVRLVDYSGSNGYYVNSPAGEYGVLYATGTAGTDVTAANQHYAVGLLYYQAGIAVITGSMFADATDNGILNDTLGTNEMSASVSNTGYNFVTASTIQVFSDSIRNRVYNIQYNNTTELNSSVYFCRANHNEFNYSSNPTYVNDSKIRVKDIETDIPKSYITTVGLYSEKKELLAVAKLSEPIKKTAENEFTLRVRLDY
ncbi:hypothetical protein OAT10_00270 [Luminiphilus sp.]|nr:hypothetical protein [Luminiphilus sp.]